MIHIINDTRALLPVALRNTNYGLVATVHAVFGFATVFSLSFLLRRLYNPQRLSTEE